MDNQGINAMPFLFLVPILFVIGCFVVDFIPIFKTKSELKDDMEYVEYLNIHTIKMLKLKYLI